jgi:hypothetical protein
VSAGGIGCAGIDRDLQSGSGSGLGLELAVG